MARSRSDRLAEALDALEKTYGHVPVVAGGGPMDQFVALFLFRDGAGEKARDAVARLREEFVDWNEVRISWAREVAEPLAAAGYREPREKAGELLAFLETIYRDRNAVNLGYFQTLEPEEAYAWIRSLEGVDDGTAAAIVALFLPEGQVLAIPEILRTAGRIGVAGKNATPAKTRKALEDVATGDEKVRMHYLFARHAEDICRARAPRCADCDANQVCDYGRAQGVAPPSKKPEPKKAQAESKKATPAKKKGAAKKETGAAKPAKRPPAKKPAAKKAPAKKAPAKKKGPGAKAVAKEPPKRAAAKKKAPAKRKAAPKKRSAPRRAAPARSAAAKKPAAKKSPAKKASAKKKAAAKQAAGKKTAARKRSPGKKTK